VRVGRFSITPQAISAAGIRGKILASSLQPSQDSPSPARHAWEKVAEGRMRALLSYDMR
jgi:hypothetical protein